MLKNGSDTLSTSIITALLFLFLASCIGNPASREDLPAFSPHLKTEIDSLPADQLNPPAAIENTAPSSVEEDVHPMPPQQDPEQLFFSDYSKRLGLFLDGTENKDLLTAIEQWLGTPYQWGGCSELGIDCSCLVKTIYEDVYGISLNRTSLSIYRYDLVNVDPDHLQEGDIVFFQIKRKPVSHMGIYLKNNRFVHASRSKGVIISDLNRRYFRRHFVSAGRPVLRERASTVQLALNDLVVVN